ncbi:unnamed protein product [Haemonchus placei]|uniref:Transmembrane protein n=1 Tax=Haemonchus placei TaxID=6290 RepID=A0A0N4W865_HAEPC|nr:unnamed protein product [Haemonchus placei]
MDFFDVRKLTSGQTKDAILLGDVRLPDYSAIAFLPVIMIGAVVLGICGVCQYKRWKHEKKQIAHLNQFYDIFEGAPLRRRKMVMVDHSDIDEVSHVDISLESVLRILQPSFTSSLSIFTSSRMFAQPLAVFFYTMWYKNHNKKKAVHGILQIAKQNPILIDISFCWASAHCLSHSAANNWMTTILSVPREGLQTTQIS